MNTNPHSIVATIACLLFFVSVAPAQQKTKEPLKLFTDSKIIPGNLRISKAVNVRVTGTAIYQITACNSDDTLVGIVTYTFTEKEQQQIAQALHSRRDEIPQKIAVKDVVASYAKGTRCPVLRLKFPAIDVLLTGKKFYLNRFTLDLKETELPVSKYICAIAWQIDRPRLRRGPCRRVNEILNGEEDQE